MTMHLREEDQIMIEIVALLRNAGIRFCHVPNERAGSVAAQVRWNRLGRQKGVPDILIFDPPRDLSETSGAALEIKSIKGAVTTEQKEWLAALRTLNWSTAVTKGFDQTLAQLRQWGYL